VVLPGRFPELICNGSSGIAVGMSTSMPPHNLGEVAEAIKALLDDPEITADELLQHVPGPDFPTGGIIMGRSGIQRAYRSGRGQIALRARHHIEEKRGRKYIVFTEIPFQVTRQSIIDSIVEALKNGRIDTISDLTDETNARVGQRLVIELKKAVDDENVTLNQLFQFTPLQSTFSIINLALVDRSAADAVVQGAARVAPGPPSGRHRAPHALSARPAKDRLHIIEGLRIALANIDEVVEIIKASASTDDARNRLRERFELSEVQARAILDMRLARLTSLEIQKLEEEYQNLLKEIAEYEAILADVRKVYAIITEQLDEMVKQYGDERRTQISSEEVSGNFDLEELIEEEMMVVTFSSQGYVKRTALDTYRSQGRGGKGVSGAELKDGDFLWKLFIASTHDYLLFFTNKARVYWKKVYNIPEQSRTSRGRAIANVIELQEDDERVTEILRVDNFDDRYLMAATKKGYVKKTALAAYSRPKKGGIKAMVLEDDDELIGVSLMTDNQGVMLATAGGVAIHFDEADARPMGRVARGVRGIKLKPGDQVVSLLAIGEDEDVLTICENGFGKRTASGEYRRQSRGGQGLINIRTSDRNGSVVSCRPVHEDDQVMFITQSGMIVRNEVKTISRIGRATQGVRIVSLRGDDHVVASARVLSEDI
jgi:DNA gyrase subunit A